MPGNGVKSRYEGSRPIVQLDWQMTRHLSTHVNYIYVFNGSFEQQSNHATAEHELHIAVDNVSLLTLR